MRISTDLKSKLVCKLFRYISNTTIEGNSLILCPIRLRTNQNQIAGTGEAYGADNALALALDKLEGNVLGRKGRHSDEACRGQLLRKLNEL